MDSLIALAFGIVTSVLGAIIVREFIDNAPRISRWLIGHAARRLPEKIQIGIARSGKLTRTNFQAYWEKYFTVSDAGCVLIK